MLTAHQIARALGVSKGRVYRALTRPYQLPYINNSVRSRGGQERLYTIGVLLPRLKQTFSLTTEQISSLFKEGGYHAC